MEHELKSWPNSFREIITLHKQFDYRKNDRNYQNGDILYLKEYNPDTGKYTGSEFKVTAEKVWDSTEIPGLPAEYVIMALGQVDEHFTTCDICGGASNDCRDDRDCECRIAPPVIPD